MSACIGLGITPEMVRAGAKEVKDYDPDEISADEIAIRVYRAMEAARLRDQHQ